MIDARFSRRAFEHSADPDELSRALSSVVLARLVGATDPGSEARTIVEELRAIGHPLWSWDESVDFIIWGDDYKNPPGKKRFLIEMQWPDPDSADDESEFGVVVTFGPWPSESEPSSK